MLYAGGDPGCLFESHDGGLTWALNRGLWDHPTRPDWTAGRRRPVPPHDRPVAGRPRPADGRDLRRRRLALRRRGATWRYSNSGIVPEYLPGGVARRTRAALRPQRPARRRAGPERLFMQFHGGVYRSDDAGATLDRRRRRHRPPVGLRLPDRRRPGRPRQRLRDPARSAPRTGRPPAARSASGRRATPARRWAAARRRACRRRTPI